MKKRLGLDKELNSGELANISTTTAAKSPLGIFPQDEENRANGEIGAHTISNANLVPKLQRFVELRNSVRQVQKCAIRLRRSVSEHRQTKSTSNLSQNGALTLKVGIL